MTSGLQPGADTPGPVWDDEVDVLCLGGVAGSLASAVVAADAGVEVLVGTTAVHDGTWLGQVSDPETLEYFAALTAELEPVEAQADAGVPMRVVQELPPPEGKGKNRKVPTFFGGRLKEWAAQCVSSPYALMHTRVSDWGTTGMRTLGDKPVQVKIVGSMALGDTGGDASLIGWLFDAAAARHLNIHTDFTLDRLVFDDGQVIGAVLETAGGPYSVGVRHGVTLAPAVSIGDSTVSAAATEVQVALVSQAGSRFARVEVLVPAATAGPAQSVPCAAGNRRLTATLRDTRRGGSEARRWRKVDRYPPFGQ